MGGSKSSRAARRILGWLPAVMVLSVINASPASAHHIKGATYTGTHSGGGAVSFTVTGDGSGISSVTATNVPAGSCTFEESTTQYATPLPIQNHAFSDTTPPMSFSGSFPGVQAAQGTVRITSFNPPCDSGDLTWNATTTASPAGSEECEEAKQAVKKAKKAVKKADSEQAKTKAKKKLKKAKQKQAAACG
jgi:hypothetical protein